MLGVHLWWKYQRYLVRTDWEVYGTRVNMVRTGVEDGVRERLPHKALKQPKLASSPRLCELPKLPSPVSRTQSPPSALPLRNTPRLTGSEGQLRFLSEAPLTTNPLLAQLLSQLHELSVLS